MKQRLAKLILALAGWKLLGTRPIDDRFVMLGVPHTSNWDFVFVFLVAWGFGVKVKWVGKSQLFRFPLGFFLRRMGGVAVDRSAAHNLVASMVERFLNEPGFKLLVPPEGTRRAVDQWKTGFYHIALNAKVPIYCGFMDYKRRETGFGPSFRPTGAYDADLRSIYEFYETITPRFPECYRSPLKALPVYGKVP